MQEVRPNAPGIVGVGDVVATKYRIDKILGIGGMGMVALATHLELHQQVALKFMLPEAMGSPAAIDRFLREARAAVRLRSEHVCRVLDVGRLEGGAPYIVMEYMVGEDFSNLVERGQMPIRDVVDYTLQILEGIADAHANGIVHRDLKPSNVFITSDTDGSPLLKVLDFGISKSSVDMGATKTGDIMGSPSYMAPEQMSSAKHVDVRADIWALGCILYESLTGGVPFTGDTLPALCMAVMTEDPAPVLSRRSDIPPALAAAVMRCLEKKPDARFSTVAELARAIAPFGAHDASTVAERIAKVLGRTTSPRAGASSNPELSATVAAPSKPPEAAPNAIATKPGKVAPLNAPGTLTGTASELVTSTQSTRSRRSPLLIGGIVVAAGASAAVAVLLSRRETPAAPPTHTAAANGSAIETPLVAGSGSATAPNEAPVDPKLAAAREHLSTVVAAFVRWSSAHPTSPCPTASDLASFVAAGIQDPWHHAVSITCTEQPEDQMMGAVSLGPDGMRSADDIASWQLGETVTGLVRGPRWAPAPTSATTATPPTTSTRTRTRPSGTSSATTTHTTSTSTPTSTTPATGTTSSTTSSPTTNAGSATKPSSGFGSDGLPIGRTTR